MQSLKEGSVELNMNNEYKRPAKNSKKKTIDKKVKKIWSYFVFIHINYVIVKINYIHSKNLV